MKNFYVVASLIVVTVFIGFQFLSFRQGERLEKVGSNFGALGKKSGSDGAVQKVYYPNGAIQAEIRTRDGKNHGLTKTYYESGRLFSEEDYVDGKQEGVSRSYYETGELLYEKLYRGGRLVTLKEFNKAGEVTFEGGF